MGQLIYTFVVEDTEKIIPKAKEDYGDEALIIANKQIHPKTTSRKGLYKVMVAIEEADYEEHLKAVGKPMSPKRTQPQAPKPVAGEEDDEAVELEFSKASLNMQEKYGNYTRPRPSLNGFKEKLSAVSPEISKVAGASLPECQAPDSQYNKKIEAFKEQTNTLSDKMNLLVDMMWDDKAEVRKNLVIPSEFASIYKQTKENGMLETHLEAIMKTAVGNMPTTMKMNKEAVQRCFHSLLRNILPCRVETDIKKQKIMMLVGPAGVGKTTALTKLAFRYAYGDKHYKTGITTLDTYRIGAVEQLFQYAKMMKLPIIDSAKPKDLDEVTKSLSSCRVILVDTIGNSQYDQTKLARTKEFLMYSNAGIDVSLVISADTKYEDLVEIHKNFFFLNIDTSIITEFNETKVFGNIFSLIYKINVPLSFFSAGQEMPDGIEVADSDFLVHCILEDFKGGNNE